MSSEQERAKLMARGLGPGFPAGQSGFGFFDGYFYALFAMGRVGHA